MKDINISLVGMLVSWKWDYNRLESGWIKKKKEINKTAVVTHNNDWWH